MAVAAWIARDSAEVVRALRVMAAEYIQAMPDRARSLSRFLRGLPTDSVRAARGGKPRTVRPREIPCSDGRLSLSAGLGYPASAVMCSGGRRRRRARGLSLLPWSWGAPLPGEVGVYGRDEVVEVGLLGGGGQAAEPGRRDDHAVAQQETRQPADLAAGHVVECLAR